MKRLSSFAVFLAWPCLAFCQNIVLKNVSIIDGTGTAVRRNTNMVITDGVIQGIGRVKPMSGPVTTLDMEGHFIMPLINNAHGHLGNVKDTTMSAANYTPENVRNQLQRYLSYGVGAILSMGTEHPVGVKIRDSSQAGLIPGAVMYSAIYGFGTKELPPVSMGFSDVYRPETV
ncbi:MAG TPA: hypothetical protein VHD83_09130, partial [Puia sp.]|nr:hypothetical protein [Puia sp.]